MWNHFDKVTVIAYFSSLIIVGVFFAFNLFIAVLSDSYVRVLYDKERVEYQQKLDTISFMKRSAENERKRDRTRKLLSIQQ
jgi:hypothetical protein